MDSGVNRTLGVRTLVGGVVMLLALNARAEDRELDVARTLYREGDFRAALVHLDAAARVPTLTEDDVVTLHWLRASCHNATGDADAAARDVDEVIRIRPTFEPDPVETPPDLRAVFSRHQEEFQALHGVVMGEPRLEDVDLVVPVSGNVPAVSEVVAHVREAGGTVFTSRALALAGNEARGPLGDLAFFQSLRGDSLELVLEARMPRGTVLSRQGHGMNPLVLVLAPGAREHAVALLTPLPEPAPPPDIQPIPLLRNEDAREDVAPSVPATGLLQTASLAAYGTTLFVVAGLALQAAASVFCPPAGLALLPVALMGAGLSAAATWIVARRFAGWRAPLAPMVLASVATTMAFALPSFLLSAGCWTGIMAIIGGALMSGRDQDTASLVWGIGSCLFVPAVAPWLVATSLGLAAGASVAAWMVRGLGRPVRWPSETSLDRDLLVLEDDGRAAPPTAADATR